MREKLKIAKNLRLSRKSFNNAEYRKICSKCYHSYLLDCILIGKQQFTITFKGKYHDSFCHRLSDWCNYVLYNIYRFFLIHFIPNNDNSLKKYQLIHFKVLKPVHYKVLNVPNELILYFYLEENGFKIVDERLLGSKKVYYVVRT